MAVISFTDQESDIFKMRKAIFRMVLSRARSRLADPVDIEETQLAELTEGLFLDDMDHSQRGRVGEALLGAVTQLKDEVSAGKPLEEPVRAGIEELLEDLEKFLRTRLQPSP
jgi:hypothetical protein